MIFVISVIGAGIFFGAIHGLIDVHRMSEKAGVFKAELQDKYKRLLKK